MRSFHLESVDFGGFAVCMYTVSFHVDELLFLISYSLVWKVTSSRDKWKIYNLLHTHVAFSASFIPVTPMSDQDRISPYSINTLSTR